VASWPLFLPQQPPCGKADISPLPEHGDQLQPTQATALKVADDLGGFLPFLNDIPRRRNKNADACSLAGDAQNERDQILARDLVGSGLR